MSFSGPDPFRRLFRDGEELTPESAKELWRITRERGEEHPDAMLLNMNALQLKSLRGLLAQRLEQRAARTAQKIADREQAASAAVHQHRRREEIEWAVSPSGALVDAAERRRDDEREAAKAASIAAMRAAEAEDLAVDAERLRQRQAAADEQFMSAAPAHLRPQ